MGEGGDDGEAVWVDTGRVGLWGCGGWELYFLKAADLLRIWHLWHRFYSKKSYGSPKIDCFTRRHGEAYFGGDRFGDKVVED